MDRKALWIIRQHLQTTRDFTLLCCLLRTQLFSAISSAAKNKKNIFFLIIYISVPSVSVCLSIPVHVSVSLTLSCCLTPVDQQSGRAYISVSSQCIHRGGQRERDSASILFVVCNLVRRVSLFVYAGVCVCVYLSDSLPHTFADVFPDANITTPITLERATHKSAL